MVASFDRVLNEKLAEVSDFATASAPRVLPFRTTPDPGVLFALLGGGAWAPASVPLAAHATGRGYRASRPEEAKAATPAPRAPAGAARPFRRPHRLTPRAQAAFDELRRVGAAGLDRAFTHIDLRREFRLLALQYHPDRHQRAGDAERARLATTFSRVTAAYRELLTVVEPAA